MVIENPQQASITKVRVYIMLTMKELKYHPITYVMPKLGETQVADLADMIKKHGLLQPGVLFEGMILDGRNRYEACKLAGVEFRTTEFMGTKEEALNHVWTINQVRRHMTSSQSAAAEARRAALSAEYAAELAEIRQEKSLRPNAGRPAKNDSKPKKNKELNSSQFVDSNLHKRDNSSRTDAKRAKEATTNREYVKKADVLLKEAPDLLDEVTDGLKTIPQAVIALNERKGIVKQPKPKKPPVATAIPADAPPPVDEDIPPVIPDYPGGVPKTPPKIRRAKGVPVSEEQHREDGKQLALMYMGYTVRAISDLNTIAPQQKRMLSIKQKLSDAYDEMRGWNV